MGEKGIDTIEKGKKRNSAAAGRHTEIVAIDRHSGPEGEDKGENRGGGASFHSKALGEKLQKKSEKSISSGRENLGKKRRGK